MLAFWILSKQGIIVISCVTRLALLGIKWIEIFGEFLSICLHSSKKVSYLHVVPVIILYGTCRKQRICLHHNTHLVKPVALNPLQSLPDSHSFSLEHQLHWKTYVLSCQKRSIVISHNHPYTESRRTRVYWGIYINFQCSKLGFCHLFSLVSSF